MKKLTGVVIILALILFGGFYGMGVVTEKTIKKNIEVINQSNGLFAEVLQYDRGFFSSNAKVKWRLHVPERVTKDAAGQSQITAAQDYQLELPVKIYHGPVIFTGNTLKFGMGYAQSAIQLPSQYTEQFDAMFTKESTKPKLDFNIFVNYFNRSVINVNVPSFKLIAKDGTGKMDWLGMDFSTSISDKADKVDGDLSIKGMELTKDNFKVIVKQVSSDYNLHQTTAGLLLGDAKFSLPSLVVSEKDNKIFEMNELLLHSTSDVKSDLFNTTLAVSIKSTQVNNQTYGPGNIKFAVRNLDATILAKLNDKASEMQNSTDLQRQQALIGMIPDLPKLLSKGPQIELSQLSFKLPQGLVKGNFLISLPKMDSSNPFELLQKIEGKAKFQFPTALLKQLMQQSLTQQLANEPQFKLELIKQIQAMQAGGQAQPEPTIEQMAAIRVDKQLAAMESAGLLKVQGPDYMLEASLNQGKLTVNGKPFDPAMLQF